MERAVIKSCGLTDREQLWDTSDVCQAFKLKAGTVRYWVHTHAISFRKIGRLTRFCPSDVFEDFDSGRMGRPGSCRKKTVGRHNKETSE